jgi:hypothetical protein
MIDMPEVKRRGMLVVAVSVRAGVSEMGMIEMQATGLFVMVSRVVHVRQAPHGAKRRVQRTASNGDGSSHLRRG